MLSDTCIGNGCQSGVPVRTEQFKSATSTIVPRTKGRYYSLSSHADSLG